MAGRRRFHGGGIGSGSGSGVITRRRLSSRPIPRRGQVKVAIAVGLAQSFAALFARAGRPPLLLSRLTRNASRLEG